MAQQPKGATPELIAFTETTGVKVPFVATSGMTLANSTNYYLSLGGQSAPLESLHVKWDATITLTLTIWSSNFDDVLVYTNTAGEWIQENPSTAYVGVTGGTVSSLTVTVAGGSAGGCVIHLGNFGARRLKAKVAVTTGGNLRAAVHGKSY